MEVIYLKRALLIILIGIILVIATIVVFISKENKTDSNINKIRVAEVTHSTFYAPWYVALKNNYFEEKPIVTVLGGSYIFFPGTAYNLYFVMRKVE